jgi:hypothetical protein
MSDLYWRQTEGIPWSHTNHSGQVINVDCPTFIHYYVNQVSESEVLYDPTLSPQEFDILISALQLSPPIPFDPVGYEQKSFEFAGRTVGLQPNVTAYILFKYKTSTVTPPPSGSMLQTLDVPAWWEAIIYERDDENGQFQLEGKEGFFKKMCGLRRSAIVQKDHSAELLFHVPTEEGNEWSWTGTPSE